VIILSFFKTLEEVFYNIYQRLINGNIFKENKPVQDKTSKDPQPTTPTSGPALTNPEDNKDHQLITSEDLEFKELKIDYGYLNEIAYMILDLPLNPSTLQLKKSLDQVNKQHDLLSRMLASKLYRVVINLKSLLIQLMEFAIAAHNLLIKN
jgi:hypothetical protein